MNQNAERPPRERQTGRAVVLAALLSVGCLLLAVLGGVWFWTQSSLVRILGELPPSAKVVRHATVRHGIDTCYLFELSCSDDALRDALVDRWCLRELTAIGEPVSFMEYDPPDWWTPHSAERTRTYGRSDEKDEMYWSMWQQVETGRVFVELGRW